MSDALYLGVDGGGTSCRARLTDAAGAVLGEGVAGSANLTLGIPVAAAAVRDAAAKAFFAAGLSPDTAGRVQAGLGVAGANVPSLADALAAFPFGFARVAVASDAATACLGAHGGRDGAILILGTGSQGFLLAGGRQVTVGGWGFHLSDDASGAILGRAAMRAALRSLDGLGPGGPLAQAVLAPFGADPEKAVLWAATATPRDYGALAPAILAHAADGDPLASALLAEGVAAVVAFVERLAALGAARVALMGGLAAAYRPLLPDRLAPLLITPEGDAMAGALILARRAG